MFLPNGQLAFRIVRLQRLGPPGKGRARIHHKLLQPALQGFRRQVQLLPGVAHPLGQLARKRSLGQKAKAGLALLQKIAQTFLQTFANSFTRRPSSAESATINSAAALGVGHAGPRQNRDRKVDLMTDRAHDRNREL